MLVSPRDAGAMDVTPLLMNCMSPDQNTRAAAEQQIEQAKVNNLVRPRQPAPLLAPLELTPPPACAQPMLMSVMATELANEAKDVGVRQSAGLVLKNCLSSKVGSGWCGGSEWASACGGVGMRACERACVRVCVRACKRARQGQARAVGYGARAGASRPPLAGRREAGGSGGAVARL